MFVFNHVLFFVDQFGKDLCQLGGSGTNLVP